MIICRGGKYDSLQSIFDRQTDTYKINCCMTAYTESLKAHAQPASGQKDWQNTEIGRTCLCLVLTDMVVFYSCQKQEIEYISTSIIIMYKRKSLRQILYRCFCLICLFLYLMNCGCCSVVTQWYHINPRPKSLSSSLSLSSC